MSFKIGFGTEHSSWKTREDTYVEPQVQPEARRSVVQVSFAGRGMSLAYYNDMFDLKRGDMVYVDGKLEGQPGTVTDVNYNFKIRLSDYKRVIAVVDRTVHGRFFAAGSHFVTFDRAALPAAKAASWFISPPRNDDEYVCGTDDTSFGLNDLSGINVNAAIAERGNRYYLENKVRYICLDGTKGYAIVTGGENYEVEFSYKNSEISGLVCSCYCSCNCKHEVAAMLQLKEILDTIDSKYTDEYNKTGYFAAVDKGTLFSFAVDGSDSGSFVL